jgi:hypothetical protein
MRIKLTSVAATVAISAAFMLCVLAGAFASALVFTDGFARLIAR